MTVTTGEQVLLSGYPYSAGGMGIGTKIVVGILILIGLGTIIFFGLGLVFWLVAYLVYRSSKGSKGPKGIGYILTNRRAMVVNSKNTNQVYAECSLADVVPISQMKRNVSDSYVGSNTRSSIATVVGDVVFMEGINVKVKFESVQDPDGIVKTVEEIKKSMYAG